MQLYNAEREIWVLFSLSEPGAEEQMQRTFAAFFPNVAVMGVDEDHPILTISPGVPRREARA